MGRLLTLPRLVLGLPRSGKRPSLILLARKLGELLQHRRTTPALRRDPVRVPRGDGHVLALELLRVPATPIAHRVRRVGVPTRDLVFELACSPQERMLEPGGRVPREGDIHIVRSEISHRGRAH